jgi:ABC-type transport system involved in multi-copper enzyme maturation permease subunit
MFNFAPWITNWLTPLWLVSAGALVGLSVLVGLWFVAALVSRIPGLSNLSENPQTRSKASLILAAIFAAMIGGMSILPSWSQWQTAGTSTLLENVTVSIVAAIVLALVAAFGVMHLVSRRVVAEVAEAVREGVLWPLFIMGLCLSLFAVMGTVVVYKPMDLFESLSRLPNVGTKTLEFTIPATDFEALGNADDPPQHAIDVNFRASEVRSLFFVSSESLTIDVEKIDSFDLDPVFRVSDDEPLRWIRAGDSLAPFNFAPDVNQLFVRNYGASDAELSLTVSTLPTHPEVYTIVITAFSIVLVFLFYILQRTSFPKLSAVALSTFKSETAQPLFAIMLTAGITALIVFVWVPYNTFGEDIKMLKDSGLTLIMVLCVIQAVWAASTSVSEEIEGRTALTVLSKPISRRSFIVGKYVGIVWTVAVLFVVLGLVLLVVVAYKPIYDARESSEIEPTWQMCHFEMIGIVPGLVLAFMETLVLASLSVAISTRLPMLGNFVICFTIYVLGHLTPLLVQSTNTAFEPVQFVAQFLATVLPNLDHFNIQAAVAAGIGVPYDYLGWTLVYSLIYGVIALLLALALFEDRDLA